MHSTVTKAKTCLTNHEQVAWPSGNSGVAAFLKPENGVNGSLAIAIGNNSQAFPVQSVHQIDAATNISHYGVSATLKVNSSAVLDLAILGSIRSIRDYTEGGGVLASEIQVSLAHLPSSARFMFLHQPAKAIMLASFGCDDPRKSVNIHRSSTGPSCDSLVFHHRALRLLC